MTTAPAHDHAGPGRCYHIDCVTDRAIEFARHADDVRQLALVWNQAAAGGVEPIDVTAGHLEDWHAKCASDDCDLQVCLQEPFDDHGAMPCCEHGFCEDHRSDCQDCTVTDRADARW